MATPNNKKEKRGPDFALKAVSVVGEGDELEKIIPPEPERTRSGGHKQLKDNLLALQEHPNEAYEVAHYAARPGSDENPTGAKKVVRQLMLKAGEKGRIAAPSPANEGEFYDIEWRSASYDGSDREGSVVIAMYVVPTK